MNDPSVREIVLVVDSPGGAVDGVETVCHAFGAMRFSSVWRGDCFTHFQSSPAPSVTRDLPFARGGRYEVRKFTFRFGWRFECNTHLNQCQSGQNTVFRAWKRWPEAKWGK